jgi:hypothetical protein
MGTGNGAVGAARSAVSGGECAVGSAGGAVGGDEIAEGGAQQLAARWR